MQSCPRCGSRTRPDERVCPTCGAPLFTFQGPVPGTMPATAPLEQSPREFSPNGSIPQASPSAEVASGSAAQPGGERWGPDLWGPEIPPTSEMLPAAPGAERTAQPPIGQPVPLREYSAGARASAGAPPRPYPPYRPPIGPSGPAAPGYAAPGYPPGAPSGQPPAYPGYAPQPAYMPYPPYPGVPAYPYGWYLPARPPRAPGETYYKALGIITIIAASLLLLGGLFGLGITMVLALTGNGEDLSIINLFVMGTLAALAGGGAGLYHAIRSLTRHPSAPFSLPSFWALLALSVVVLGAGIALFAAKLPTGPLALIEPLALLSGAMPALAVLSLGLQRLRPDVSWRRAALALTSGATLAVGVGSVLELVLALALLGAASLNFDPSVLNPNGSFGTIAILILVAVIAPLVEETTKQISGFFLLPRMKGPQEAFLIGLAAGVGFAIVETAGYVGTAQADWVGIALGRVGGGLLHGMGAAMAGVGWYYLIRGQGARGRWRIGALFLAYAYLQHAIFNGGQVLLVQIPALQTWHVDLFDLRFDATSVYAGGLYLIIVGIMLVVIRWLRQSAPVPAGGGPAPSGSTAASSSRPEANNLSGRTAGAAPTNTLSVGEPGGKAAGNAGAPAAGGAA